MAGYFDGCKTLDEVKTLYRQLAINNHPDHGGDTDTMQEINNAYEAAREWFANNADSDRVRATASQEVPGEFASFIAFILPYLRKDLLAVEQTGRWFWISGQTKEHKDALKAAGCRWASQKKLWYWRPTEAAMPGRHKPTNMADIRAKYGSSNLRASDNQTQFVLPA